MTDPERGLPPADAGKEMMRKLVQEEYQRIVQGVEHLTRQGARELFPWLEARRPQYEIVRNASFQPLDAADVYRPGGIRDSYQKVWLKPEDAKLITEQRIAEFERRAEKGFFVFKGDEVPMDRKRKQYRPVLDQMFADLENAASGDDQNGRYTGYCLTDPEKNDDIITWATWLQPPAELQMRGKGTPYYKKIERLLRKGVTGRMHYVLSDLRRQYIDVIPHLLYFDTVASNVAMGAQRLFAEITPKMLGVHDAVVNHVILYRLHAIEMRKRLYRATEKLTRSQREEDYVTTSITPLGANVSSDRFFTARGCRPFALDYSSDGPTSVRVIGGERYRLLPSWQWMSGTMVDLHNNSSKIWQKTQDEFGTQASKG